MCRMNTFMSDPNSAWKARAPPQSQIRTKVSRCCVQWGSEWVCFCDILLWFITSTGWYLYPVRLFELPIRSDLVWSDLVFQCLSGIGCVPNWIKGNLTRRPWFFWQLWYVMVSGSIKTNPLTCEWGDCSHCVGRSDKKNQGVSPPQKRRYTQAMS